MEPPPERSIAGTTAFIPSSHAAVDLNVPLPERVIGVHQCARLVDPGVVDQAVQAAELLGGLNGAGPIGFRGHIVPNESRGRPELSRKLLTLIVQHVADHHLRTLRHQQAGLRRALAARPAAHEHHLVVEACHVRSPLQLQTSGVWRIGAASSRSGDLEYHLENYLAGLSRRLFGLRAGLILLVGHLFHPVDDVAVEPFPDGDMGLGQRCRSTVPMLLAGRKPHHITGVPNAVW